jgi:hypothetical protein
MSRGLRPWVADAGSTMLNVDDRSRRGMSQMTTTAFQGLAAPLGLVEEGHLVFARGASRLTIGVDGTMEDLFRARFDGKPPEFRTDGGIVTVKYRPSFHPPRGELTLSGRVPWAIDARWGMSNVVADLAELELTQLDISGGASGVEVRLPRPKASIAIRIGGGASDVELIRPADVPVRVQVGAGTSNLVIDGIAVEHGMRTDRKTPGYDVTTARYDIEIGAGASKVRVRS